MTAFKTGPTIRVLLDADGRPTCPHCGDPLMRVEHNFWQCPFGAAMSQQFRQSLSRYVAPEGSK